LETTDEQIKKNWEVFQKTQNGLQQDKLQLQMVRLS